MKKQPFDLEDWETTLSEYEDDKTTAEYVLDKALDLMEDLAEHTEEGRYYETKFVKVSKGEPLPELYQELTAISFLTDSMVAFKVMGIKEVKWAGDGVIVEVYAKKVQK